MGLRLKRISQVEYQFWHSHYKNEQSNVIRESSNDCSLNLKTYFAIKFSLKKHISYSINFML